MFLGPPWIDREPQSRTLVCLRRVELEVGKKEM